MNITMKTDMCEVIDVTMGTNTCKVVNTYTVYQHVVHTRLATVIGSVQCYPS